MVTSFALALSLACPKTLVENKSHLRWTHFDQHTLYASAYRCGRIYPESPCLKKFRKTGYHAHQVTCGQNTLASR
jgi:hypothetical protein